MAKSNWDILKHQSDKESNAHRDVYADQQLDRGKNEKIHTMTGWNILAVSGGIGTAIVTYLILGMLALAAFSLGNLGDNISQSIGHNGAKTEQRAATPNMLAGNDISSVTDVLIKHDEHKGYRLVNMSGDPRTKWVKQINELPIAGNWTVLNAKLYHFIHEGKASDSSITTVGRIKTHKSAIKPKSQKEKEGQKSNTTVSAFLLKPTAKKVMYSLLAGMCVYLLLYELGKRKLKVQNVMSDNSDINSYRGDQHIMLPEEMMRHFTPYPDAGAHSWIQPSSMISHTAISNKGLNPVMLTQFYKADVIDPKTHETIALKGEPKVDQNGYLIQKRVPMINEKFMDALFTASDVPKDKSIRKYYDPTKIPFPNKGYESDAISEMGHWKKLGVHTVADLINKDWKLPAYETQRPAGVYWMDVAPVNTMVLAITRAGKGQTYIEPLIDAWTREQRPNNIVINDPKGELLKEFYVPATYRGFQIVQFNLINSMNTDIYNPLIMASEAAREGNFKKAAQYVDSIGNVFFPKDGGDDPVWPNAANNAFKRTAFGLIDYYLEEEHELRLEARQKHTDPKVLATQIDKLWGHVTLYNCYEMFVRLSSKKITNPINQYNAMNKSGELDKQIIKELADKGILDDDPEYDQKKQDLAMKKQETAKKQAVLWNGQPTQDELTLFFNASERLPGNSMRDLVNNANHALTAMAGADQMLASCDLQAI